MSLDRHYRVQALFLPAFGLGIWLLMGGIVHLTLRTAGRDSRFDAVLNLIGVGMLVPMPPLRAADVAMTATDQYRLPGLAVTHATVELWEAASCVGIAASSADDGPTPT